ncbi:MAG: hypothetical protein BWY71_01921 [Planctomycetes bacterium ADurb.Bin412]|nr:MAG: hypothetical protein BWY71_01921 [Planctomycetes bacterium ADurb.Bin412]
MHPQFKLRKLALPEYRLPHPFHIIHQQAQPHLHLLDFRQHPVHQQRLVKRRGHLRHKQRIIRGRIRLGLVGIIAVQRMPQLMHQRTDIVVTLVVVHQDIRMHIVRAAAGIRPRLLARRRIYINPPPGKCPPHHLRVLRPHRFHRRQNQLFRLFHRILLVHLLDHRGIHIAVLQLLHPQHPLLQTQIPVQRFQILIHVLQQSLINRHRNVKLVQLACQRTGIMPRPGIKHVPFDTRIKLHPERPLKPVQTPPERLKHLLPVLPLRNRPVAGITGLVQRYGLTVAECQLRIREVRIAEYLVDRGGRVCQ